MGTPLRHQNLKKLKTLFLSTLYISAFTFGGGFVIVGFMRRKFVHDLHWIDEEEMLDFAALAQSCPGAVAVNAAWKPELPPQFWMLPATLAWQLLKQKAAFPFLLWQGLLF